MKYSCSNRMPNIDVRNVRFLLLSVCSRGPGGRLIIGESEMNIPFKIRRFYSISHVSDISAQRGLHAHKKLQQVIICLQGKCCLLVDDGMKRRRITLCPSNYGVYIGPDVWRVLEHFSPDCVILVLADAHFKESDYIRDYRKFLKHVGVIAASKP